MQEMKTMLEGKNMTCLYTKGNFDPRLVTSLVGGIEYCSGDLKDDITHLMLFT
jgi:ABC-type Zn2+ transport system substrate-binding protein/surface adhesin